MVFTTARRAAIARTPGRKASPDERTAASAGSAPGAVVGNRRRRHGAGVPFDRDELERSGWRTTLDYRENHVRRRDGRLDHLEVVWHAEAERTAEDGSTMVVSAAAHTPNKAWSRLRSEADLAACRTGANRAPVSTPRSADGRVARGSPPRWSIA
ncbi:MAG: hypothetical protein AAFP84_02835 [Actinomycetota bacterium]